MWFKILYPLEMGTAYLCSETYISLLHIVLVSLKLLSTWKY